MGGTCCGWIHIEADACDEGVLENKRVRRAPQLQVPGPPEQPASPVPAESLVPRQLELEAGAHGPPAT